MIPLPDVLRSIRGTRNKVNKWKAERYLSRTLKDGSPGVPSMISCDAALEIAFMSVLTRSGLSPKDSKELANELVSKQSAETVPIYCLVNPQHLFIYYAQRIEELGGLIQKITESVDEPKDRDGPIGVSAERPVASFILINIEEITRRIRFLETRT